MKILKIQATEDTPEIYFDLDQNKFKISGISMPENSITFYQPIFDWMDEYFHPSNNKVEIELELKYINTISHKMILNLLLKIDEVYDSGSDITVIWSSSKSDNDMLETGQDFCDLVNMPFDFKNIIFNEKN